MDANSALRIRYSPLCNPSPGSAKADSLIDHLQRQLRDQEAVSNAKIQELRTAAEERCETLRHEAHEAQVASSQAHEQAMAQLQSEMVLAAEMAAETQKMEARLNSWPRPDPKS